jgi:GNAT superfamily N-acetyltransferase
MEFQILITKIDKIEPNLFQQLLRLTLKPQDMMRDDAIFARQYPDSFLAKSDVIIFLNKKMAMAWAIISDYPFPRNSKTLFLFVKKKYRKQGYGTQLFNIAQQLVKEEGKRIVVCPHDYQSSKFFSKIGIKRQQVVKGYLIVG